MPLSSLPWPELPEPRARPPTCSAKPSSCPSTTDPSLALDLNPPFQGNPLMPGWLTNDVPLLATFAGVEQINADTELAAGQAPQSGAFSFVQLAAMFAFLSNSKDKTTVAGSRYFTSVQIGEAVQLNGISVLIGSTGGTDNWLVELHNAAGVLVATSNTAGALV